MPGYIYLYGYQDIDSICTHAEDVWIHKITLVWNKIFQDLFAINKFYL